MKNCKQANKQKKHVMLHDVIPVTLGDTLSYDLHFVLKLGVAHSSSLQAAGAIFRVLICALPCIPFPNSVCKIDFK